MAGRRDTRLHDMAFERLRWRIRLRLPHRLHSRSLPRRCRRVRLAGKRRNRAGQWDGWAGLQDDGSLEGGICLLNGDTIPFVARRSKASSTACQSHIGSD